MKHHLTLCVLALAKAASCQVVSPDDPRGAFQSVPHFFSLANPTGISDLAWKLEGDIPSTFPMVAGLPTGSSADFRRTAMFDAALGALISLDGISSGNDHIPSPSSITVGTSVFHGCLIPAPGGVGWVAITYSVTNGSTRTGTIMATRHANLQGAVGADLYGYFLPGSNVDPATGGVPANLVDRIYLEQGREHMNLPLNSEVDGHDALMPYVQAGFPTGPVLRRNDVFYFSITKASAAAISSTLGSTWLQNPPASPPYASGADIYEIRWDPTMRTWSRPSLCRSAASMDLDPVLDDIKALGVWAPVISQPENVVLFATDRNDGINLRVQGARSTPVNQARNRDGTPIVMVTTGRIDGISVYDPETIISARGLGLPAADGLLRMPGLGLCITSENPAGAPLVSVSGFTRSDVGVVKVYAATAGVVTLCDAFNSDGRRHTVQRRVNIKANANAEVVVWAEFATDARSKYSWKARIMR